MKLTKENAAQILSCKRDEADKRDYSFSTTVPDTVEKRIKVAPSIVSHNEKMTGIRDQGRLGSCVSFAVAAVKEWQEKVEHEAEVSAGKVDHRKGKQYNLSESWIYWNAKKIDPWPNEEGTSIRCGMKVIRSLGTPCEEAWPYNDINYGEPKSWAPLIARWARVESYWRINNLTELKLALLEGPTVIGIPCFEEIFYTDETGYIPYPANPNMIYGGHAICVTGYNDSQNIVTFKNSWGKGWGSRGYGFLTYRYINDFLWDAWACKDVSMTKELLKEEKSLFGL